MFYSKNLIRSSIRYDWENLIWEYSGFFEKKINRWLYNLTVKRKMLITNDYSLSRFIILMFEAYHVKLGKYDFTFLYEKSEISYIKCTCTVKMQLKIQLKLRVLNCKLSNLLMTKAWKHFIKLKLSLKSLFLLHIPTKKKKPWGGKKAL